MTEHLLQPTDSANDAVPEPAPNTNLPRGRPGMELWSMLLLALLRQGICYGFDRPPDPQKQPLRAAVHPDRAGLPAHRLEHCPGTAARGLHGSSHCDWRLESPCPSP